ncbi:hypothetical protein GDO81_012081 [Engystomops pustulosus]|uniref:Uncharacterized protein n=1 Tax=Engystomops pustulosus TaxID=76066 RepID=A0AAV7BJQ4_ENGPU|nr:hypothetical protein GDO81_012081 [Engystomops pustulosus]
MSIKSWYTIFKNLFKFSCPNTLKVLCFTILPWWRMQSPHSYAFFSSSKGSVASHQHSSCSEGLSADCSSGCFPIVYRMSPVLFTKC